MRLIDADALREKLTRSALNMKNEKDIRARAVVVCCRNVLDEEPTIDPSTLRPKGEWIHRAVDAWECIHCKDESDYTYDFCPHCGADMRKGKDDETDHG